MQSYQHSISEFESQGKSWTFDSWRISVYTAGYFWEWTSIYAKAEIFSICRNLNPRYCAKAYKLCIWENDTGIGLRIFVFFLSFWYIANRFNVVNCRFPSCELWSTEESLINFSFNAKTLVSSFMYSDVCC